MNKELNSKIDNTLKSLEQGLDDYYAMCKKFEDDVSAMWVKEKPTNSGILRTSKQGAIKFYEKIMGRSATDKEQSMFRDGRYDIGDTGFKYIGKYE